MHDNAPVNKAFSIPKKLSDKNGKNVKKLRNGKQLPAIVVSLHVNRWPVVQWMSLRYPFGVNSDIPDKRML